MCVAIRMTTTRRMREFYLNATSQIRGSAIFIYSRVRRAINGAVSLRLTKKKVRRNGFSGGVLQLPSERVRIPMRDAGWWATEAVPDTAAVTLFCLVNRIFAQSCACVATRGDPRTADARDSMHIADFQNDIAACLACSMKFQQLLCALCCNFATSQEDKKKITRESRFIFCRKIIQRCRRNSIFLNWI